MGRARAVSIVLASHGKRRHITDRPELSHYWLGHPVIRSAAGAGARVPLRVTGGHEGGGGADPPGVRKIIISGERGGCNIIGGAALKPVLRWSLN